MAYTPKIFTLKRGDTKPVLEVTLKEPDPVNAGQLRVHDLTGSTAWKLHIWLADGTKLTRDMTKVGADAAGTLRYVWLNSDWDPGQLVAGPSIPLVPGQREHYMEYEVLGGASSKLTFPNGGYDILRIIADVA